MRGSDIRSRPGMDWGEQGGLLSAAECDALYDLVQANQGRWLEVGHYHGLSTAVICEALGSFGWLMSIDSHEKDAWVPATSVAPFEANVLGKGYPLEHRYERSQTLTEALPHDAVFYDGDHGEEQMRITRLVIDSPEVRLLVFDDMDFEVPSQCARLLRDSGWADESPPTRRWEKSVPKTMTLGVFRR